MTLSVLSRPSQGAPQAVFLFAHGAGAPMDSPFMESITDLLTARGLSIIRFEFPYMAQRRQGGSKRPPNRQTELLETWREVIEQQRPADLPLLIGGKSMGGRMATLVADEAGVQGVVCLGYPFHPPGKPEKRRLEGLQTLQTPTLILQGTRDALGNREEVADYELPANIQLHWLEDGDHSFKPRKRSGLTQEQLLVEAADTVQEFAASQSR